MKTPIISTNEIIFVTCIFFKQDLPTADDHSANQTKKLTVNVKYVN